MRFINNVSWVSIGALLSLASCATTRTEDSNTGDAKVGVTRQAVSQTFGAGSLVIPMDNALQNQGMFHAYGLAYALLRANVTVHWAISDTKTVGDPTDFTISAPTTAVNRDTGAAIAFPLSYRGGPFVIDAASRTAALPVIDAWLDTFPDVVVHDITGGSFTANIMRTMTAAPSIAVFEDGNQDIAYDNFAAAGILDSAGNPWSDASPGALTAAQIEGPGAAANIANGALFVTGTTFPAYAFLVSEHYTAPGSGEVVAEVRSWLDAGPHTHAFMQCEAATTFENMAPAGPLTGGRFLTTAGLDAPGNASNFPAPVTVRLPREPLAQMDGPVAGDTGTTPTMSLVSGQFRNGVRTIANEDDEPLGEEILLLDGNLDGDTSNGRVTYLAGHDFDDTPPMSGAPLTNGVRIFLNALLDSPATLPANQPNLQVTLSAAPSSPTNASSVTYTITYTNTGSAPALGVTLTDPVPAGSTFGSATNGGTQAGGIVTWNIGAVGPGGTGQVQYTVNIAADGTLTNQATGSYLAWQTARTAQSNTTSTTRDTLAPETQILSGPPATTSSTTANFDFGPNDAGTTFECKLDAAADFSPCNDPEIFSGLTVGQHTLEVRAKDGAGNVDPTPAVHTWTITEGGGGDAGNVDSDGDGLTDAEEQRIGSDPNDADSDDDGVPDGLEPDYDKDTDGDGLINVLDPDSDNDGLFDGTELGRDCAGPQTDISKGHCVADADNGATKTDPLDRDTDDGGVSDGSEDANLNGAIDPGETDPTVGHGADDTTVTDSDGDGLSDALEGTLGSDPNDADSDDDGVIDGEEPNPADDTDLDGRKNVLDADSDGDGLFDGTEMGKACDNAQTDRRKNTCIADADPASRTSPILRDTDRGGVIDGEEDTNKDGKVDPGERDPNVAADDRPGAESCTADSQCGGIGRICRDDRTCGPGCRGGAAPIACAAPQVCSSTTNLPGTCVAGPVQAGPPNPNVLEGGGLSCNASPENASHGSPAALVLLATAALSGLRRRKNHR